MRAANGAGLAAPQIGESLRLVIFELAENPRYPDLTLVPYTVLINPVLTPIGDEQRKAGKAASPSPGCGDSSAFSGGSATRDSMRQGSNTSTAPSKVFTRAWCSTRSTISMVC